MLRLSQGAAGKSALAAFLGHKTVSGELHRQIRRLLDRGMIEMTIPDKPSSRLQKYRLTEQGRRIVVMNANDDVTVNYPESDAAREKFPGMAVKDDG